MIARKGFTEEWLGRVRRGGSVGTLSSGDLSFAYAKEGHWSQLKPRRLRRPKSCDRTKGHNGKGGRMRSPLWCCW